MRGVAVDSDPLVPTAVHVCPSPRVRMRALPRSPQVSPVDLNADETFSTLEFASRTRKVQLGKAFL